MGTEYASGTLERRPRPDGEWRQDIAEGCIAVHEGVGEAADKADSGACVSWALRCRDEGAI
jgi:hypothetical protein